MKRVLLILILGSAAVWFTTSFNRRAGDQSVRRDMHDILDAIDLTEAQRRYLSDLVDRFHPDIIEDTLSASGTSVRGARYVETMFDRLIESARRDGKSAALIDRLKAEREAHVAANRDDGSARTRDGGG